MKQEEMADNHKQLQNEVHAHLQGLYKNSDLSHRTGEERPLDRFLEVSGLVSDPELGLLLNGFSLRRSTRRWSEILSAASNGVFVWNREMAQKLVREGTDPVIYEGYRDILPFRRSKGLKIHDNENIEAHIFDELLWRADLVVYTSGVFPTGELYRSVGHWNPLDEWEVFQVCYGKAIMVCASKDVTKQWHIEVVECGPGDIYTIKPGTWHLTYPLSDQTVIFNIYSSTIPSTPIELGPFVGKYEARSHDGPELTIVQRSAQLQVVWGDGLIEAKAPFPPPNSAATLHRGEEWWMGKWFSLSSQAILEQKLVELVEV